MKRIAGRSLNPATVAIVGSFLTLGAAQGQDLAASRLSSGRHAPACAQTVGAVVYDQGFYCGGYQYPAGGYGGGPYRRAAYSAADVYIWVPCGVVHDGWSARASDAVYGSHRKRAP